MKFLGLQVMIDEVILNNNNNDNDNNNDRNKNNTNFRWNAWNCLQESRKETGWNRNHPDQRDHTGHSTVKIHQDTEKILGDLRRLAVTQAKNRLFELMRKTHIEWKWLSCQRAEEGDSDATYNWRSWNSHQELGKDTEWNQRKNRDHPDHILSNIPQVEVWRFDRLVGAGGYFQLKTAMRMFALRVLTLLYFVNVFLVLKF